MVYVATIFMLTLSGFAQMPIFKRYYIADIPGLGWLAQFYVTHTIHYLSAITFIALTTYVVVDFVALHRKQLQITLWGYLRLAVLAGLLASGVLLVVRNLPGTHLGSGFIIFLDISHLGLVMILLGISLASLVLKKAWLISRCQ